MKTNRQQISGFTLIEILIVLVIMSIVATFAVISVGDWGQSRKIKSITDELSLAISSAEQQAILQPEELGLVFFNNGYQFFKRSIDKTDNTVHWNAINNELFGFKEIPNSITVKVEVNSKPVANAASGSSPTPILLISSSGNISPFTLEIGQKKSPALYRIIGNFDGTITVKKLETKIVTGAIGRAS